MTSTERVAQYEELVRRFASVLSGSQLYGPDHPLVLRGLEAFTAVLGDLHAAAPSIIIGVIGQELVVEDTPLLRTGASLADLLGRLHSAGIERITIDRGVTVAEVGRFVEALTTLTARRPPQRAMGACQPAPHPGEPLREGQGSRAQHQRHGDDTAAVRPDSQGCPGALGERSHGRHAGCGSGTRRHRGPRRGRRPEPDGRSGLDRDEGVRQLHIHTHGERVHPYYGSGAGAADRRTERWTPEFGQLAKVGSRPRRRSLACHGSDGVILLS